MGLITYFQDKIENKRLKDRINNILSITTLKEFSMGQWKDVTPVVESISEDTISIRLQDGTMYNYPMQKLKSYMEGEDSVETFFRNMAIKLALSKVDMSNSVQVAQIINNSNFKKD